MDGSVSDEAFTRHVSQIGIVRPDHLKLAAAIQSERAKRGEFSSLAGILVEQGIITAATREAVEKNLRSGTAVRPPVPAGTPVETIRRPGGSLPARAKRQQEALEQRGTARSVGMPEREAAKPGASSRKGLYIACSVAGLGMVVFIVVMAMSGDRDEPKTGASRAGEMAKSEIKSTKAASALQTVPRNLQAEEARLKELAAKLESDKLKVENDKRAAEIARKAVEAALLAADRERKKAEAKSEIRNPKPEGNAKTEIAKTDPAAAPVQAETKKEKPEGQNQKPESDIAGARAARAQQLFSAVLKNLAPLLAQNKFAEATAMLEQKLRDPSLAEAVEMLKQEKADIETVAELRRQAVEALRKQVGQTVTLKRGNGTITGKVVDDPKRDGVTLNVGGPEMSVRAEQILSDDIDTHAPKQANAAEDLRQRGLLHLLAGNLPKAKEYFARLRDLYQALEPKPSALDPGPYLDRIKAVEMSEVEAAALKAWENAEACFQRKQMREAKGAYEKFEHEHGQTQTAVKQAAVLKERYAAIEAASAPDRELTLELGGGVKMEFVLVKAGEFEMGSGDGSEEQKPAHKVRISKPFYIGKYDVTVAQFRRFADTAKYRTECEKDGDKGAQSIKDGKWQELSGVNWRAPGFEQTPEHPVVLVSWNDAQAFATWLSKLSGREVHLPTEAQWEYAARGPQGLKFPWGNNWDGTKANHADRTLKNAGINKEIEENIESDGYAYTSPVGEYKNSSWCGAFDMVGNVWQWCQDCFGDKYYAQSAAADPPGPPKGADRVARGGSFLDYGSLCQGAFRWHCATHCRMAHMGFRMVAVCFLPKTP